MFISSEDRNNIIEDKETFNMNLELKEECLIIAFSI